MATRFLLLGLIGLFWLATGTTPAAGQTKSVTSVTTQTPAAVATTAWQAVEVLVFRNVSPLDAQGETWPATVAAPSLDHAVYPGVAKTGAYAALSGHGSLAANALLKLERTGHYAIIATLGWQQPVDTSRPVSFTPIPATGSGGTSLHANMVVGKTDQPTTRLTGTARLLSVGQRAYVTLHLRLCEPTPAGIIVQTPLAMTEGAAASASVSMPAAATVSPNQPIVPGEQCFALNQRHEIESGKLAYFDNPAFGALVSVRSIKQPGLH